MLDQLFRNPNRSLHLSAADRELLRSRARRIQQFKPHVDIISEGDNPHVVNLVLKGWAYRYKQLEDGRRQILSFFVPGDLCDPCVFYLPQMGHALGTLTAVTVARIDQDDMTALMAENPAFTRVMWCDLLLNAERQREWTVSLGRRTAIERLAHLFCELVVRMRQVGLADASGCDLPITQADLADALGLSPVHINRTLQELRAMKLLEVKGRRLVLYDEAALRSVALFNPGYMHYPDDV